MQGNLTFTLSLSNPSSGAVLGEQTTATVMLIDNDTGGLACGVFPATFVGTSAAETLIGTAGPDVMTRG